MTRNVLGRSSILVIFSSAFAMLTLMSCQDEEGPKSLAGQVRMMASLACDESSTMLMLDDEFDYESDYAGRTCVSWKRGEAGWLSMDVIDLEFGCYSEWVASMGESTTADYTVVIDQNDFSEDECGWPGCMCDHNWSFDLNVGDEDRDLTIDIVVNDCGSFEPVRKTVEIKAEELDLGITCFEKEEDDEFSKEGIVDDFEFTSSGCEETSFMAPPGEPNDPPAATPGYGTPDPEMPCLNWSFDTASGELHLALAHMLGCGTKWIPSVTVDGEMYNVDIIEDDDCTDVGCSCPYEQNIDIPIKGEPSLIVVSIEFWTCEEVFRSVDFQADLSGETQGEICDW